MCSILYKLLKLLEFFTAWSSVIGGVLDKNVFSQSGFFFMWGEASSSETCMW